MVCVQTISLTQIMRLDWSLSLALFRYFSPSEINQEHCLFRQDKENGQQIGISPAPSKQTKLWLLDVFKKQNLRRLIP